ncbi:MAG: AAA family ATPase [Solirubrobacteraceae bacterium]
MPKTIADHLAALDRDRFRGRVTELARFDAVLAESGPERVVFVHGPGGIGKSTLLREVARRAAARGFAPRVIDGRDVVPVPGDIEAAVGEFDGGPPPLLIFDSYERMSGADGWLRRTLLPTLPESAVVVIAGRRPPAPEWFRDGWELLVAELELGPLPEEEALALLAAQGIGDRDADELVAWARGWPLALSLAAEAAGSDAVGSADLHRHPDVLRGAVARIARAELEQGNLDVIGVAAIARSSDARLLADVVPDVDPDVAMSWLQQLAFAETVRGGVSLHDAVRSALRADLEARHPERARNLRRRIADHFHDRAVGGEPHTLIDLTELIDDPALRWGLGAEGSVRYRIDALQPSGRDALAPWYGTRPTWWRDIDAFLRDAPECVVLARDAADRLAGLSIAVTVADPPAIAEQDTVLRRWLAHARTLGTDAVLLWRDSTDFQRNADPSSPVVSLMNTASILGSGLANVRYSFIPLDPSNQAAVRFSHSVNGRSVPELAVELDGRLLECHVIDHGAGGMIGQLREVLYAELRLPRGDVRPGPVATPEAVRDALRDLHRPAKLATNPLARGDTPDERVGSVRMLINSAVIQAFGDSADEVLLRETLERGYLDPDSKHEQVAERLNLSRTAYFRRLRQATGRLTDWLAG